MRSSRTGSSVVVIAMLFAAIVTPAFSQTSADVPRKDTASSEEVSALRQQIAEQQMQIKTLQETMKAMLDRLDKVAGKAQPASPQIPNQGQVASLAPVVRAGDGGASGSAALTPLPDPGKAPVTQDEMQGFTKKVDAMGKTVETLSKGVSGFRFGGDFRYRFDSIWRTANSIGGPQQNVRERYRLRFNVDKPISNQFDAHFQLGSGTFNNPLTFDTDFAGANNRGPIFITEFWGTYHPNKRVELRAGKMPEVFADNSRFFFDDDLRLNGFQETFRIPLERNGIGLKNIEFRGGQYILTNPNVQVLPSAAACSGTTPPAACAYETAGFLPGQKVRDANLFDLGVVFMGDIKEGWSHQLTVNAQLWRNQNEVQLASLTAGFPLLVTGYYGVQPSGGPPGTGTATTTKGGAIFTAHAFQVERVNYRITHVGWKTHRQGFPVWLDLQASRNFGVGFANNALMGTFGVGEVKGLGDWRFLYQYGLKDANSMIAQVTDDDFGTGTGVNLKTHAIRLDVGLNKFLEWDNKLFIQNPVRGNEPARNLFVTVPRGVNTAYRVQSEFNVKF